MAKAEKAAVSAEDYVPNAGMVVASPPLKLSELPICTIDFKQFQKELLESCQQAFCLPKKGVMPTIHFELEMVNPFIGEMYVMPQHFRKIDPIYKSAWCKALRSGQYVQCYGRMSEQSIDCYTTRYCALGVFGKAFGGIPSDNGKWLNENQAVTIGLTTAHQKAIAHLNDIQRLTFPEIADFIERNF